LLRQPLVKNDVMRVFKLHSFVSISAKSLLIPCHFTPPSLVQLKKFSASASRVITEDETALLTRWKCQWDTNYVFSWRLGRPLTEPTDLPHKGVTREQYHGPLRLQQWYLLNAFRGAIRPVQAKTTL